MIPKIIKNTSWYKKHHSNKVLLWREISPLAIPIFIENFSVILMGILSTFLVSWLGKVEVAAIGLTESFNIIISSFFMAVALGTSVIVAFSLGRHNKKRASAAARQSISLLVLVAILLVIVIEISGYWIIELIAGKADPDVKAYSLLFLRITAWGYPAIAIVLVGCGALRGAGNTRLPMYLNIAMNLCNICISYILIYGGLGWQGLGFIGAGIGITIARYIGVLFILFALTFKPSRFLNIPFKTFFYPFSTKILAEVLSIGIPASVESIMFNLGKLLTQTFVAGMGTTTIAANFIAFSIAGLLNLPGNTLGSTSTIIIGRRVGMGQIGQPTRELKYIFHLTNIWLCTIAIVSIPLAAPLVSLYTNDIDVIETAKYLLWFNALFTPFWAASFVLPYGFKGAKDANYAMWVAIFSMWACRIVAGYILGILLGFGVYGVWLGMFLDWIIRAILFYYRLFKGTWLWRYKKI